MIAFDYLYRGLCGLAQAHRASVLSGHLGAAVTAGYFFGEEHPDLDNQVNSAVETQLDRIIAGDEGTWFNQHKAGITIGELFEPLPEEEPQPDLIGTIAEALAANIDQPRQSGHNVIFASIAIRALKDHPQYATPGVVGGVRRLIAGFNGAVPGRGYYGKERGWISGEKVELPEEPDNQPYVSLHELAEVVIGELIQSASVHRQGFGGLFHLINHAAGLTELSQYGFEDLAHSGLAAHHQHLRLLRSLPDVENELGKLVRAEHDPRTPEYWNEKLSKQWSAQLTHRIKTLYGFHTLLRYVDDEQKRARAREQFLYLMG
jgi:hypothetical protein